MTNCKLIYWVVHENSVLIAYVQLSLMNAHADISSKARGRCHSQSLLLHSFSAYAGRKTAVQAQTRMNLRCSLM